MFLKKGQGVYMEKVDSEWKKSRSNNTEIDIPRGKWLSFDKAMIVKKQNNKCTLFFTITVIVSKVFIFKK